MSQHPQLVQSMSNLVQQLDRFAAENRASVESRLSQESALIPEVKLSPGLIEILPIGVFITNALGHNIYVNPHYQKILGYSFEAALGHDWLNYVHPDDRDRIFTPWIKDATTGYNCCNEYRIITAQSEIQWVRVQTIPIFDTQGKLTGHIGTLENITSQKLAQNQLQETLCEKEALLKEVHHRVKNNLQVISSLLYLQSHRIDDEQVRQFFEDSQSRINSMALVHDTLYRSEVFAQINLSEYVQTLTTNLFHTYRIQPELVKLNLQIEGNIMVEIDQAIPCGLILNELITNALKHGFSSEQTGHIIVTLKNISDQVCLIVENDGNSLPEDFKLGESRSMGLRLVNSLVNQLQGKIQVQKNHRTCFKVTFKQG